MTSAKRFLLSVLAVLALPSVSIAQTAAPAPTVAPATVTSVPVSPSTTTPAPAPSADEGYIIGPEDVIEVNVLGQPEFRTQARVESDGSIALPFLGKQQVNGQTPLTLAAAVSSRLKAGGYYTNPVATVILSPASA
jgi:polysaccharide export outer membrane protein